MSLLTEIKRTVLQGQQLQVVGPNQDQVYPVLQNARATFKYDTVSGPGPYHIPFDTPIPKGAYTFGYMFNILETPVGPTQIYIEVGSPWFFNLASPNPIGVPWNQGTNTYEFAVAALATSDAESMYLQFDAPAPATAGHFSLNVSFIAP